MKTSSLHSRCVLVISTASLLLGGCPKSGRPPVAGRPRLSRDDARLAAELIRRAEADPGRFKAEQRARLLGLAREVKCPCAGLGVLADCARKETCLRAPFAVRALLRGVVRGEKDAQIISRLLERFGPRERERVDLSSAPCRGRADAPVTIVVFSDFQCPYCAAAGKLLAIVERHAGRYLRVCFKNFVVHESSRLAAQAALAAHAQGAFWRYHDRLHQYHKAQERDDLLGYARSLGLDEARFARDLAAAAARVKADGAEARRLDLRGTPAFLINGRLMTDPLTVPDFLDWIAEELALRRARARKGGASQPASTPVSHPARR